MGRRRHVRRRISRVYGKSSPPLSAGALGSVVCCSRVCCLKCHARTHHQHGTRGHKQRHTLIHGATGPRCRLHTDVSQDHDQAEDARQTLKHEAGSLSTAAAAPPLDGVCHASFLNFVELAPPGPGGVGWRYTTTCQHRRGGLSGEGRGRREGRDPLALNAGVREVACVMLSVLPLHLLQLMISSRQQPSIYRIPSN